MPLDLRLATTETIYGNQPVKVKCPLGRHPDPNPSFVVWPDNAHCFSCGAHFNDWDEALSLLLGVTVAEAVDVASRYETDNLDAYREVAGRKAPREPLVRERAVLFNRFLQSDRRERATWLLNRGLTWETINEHLLGHDGFRFTIPVLNGNGELLTIRYRKDDKYIPDVYEYEDGKTKRNPKYTGMPGRNGLYLFGEVWLAKERPSSVVLCEGELDALRLRQAGVSSCSATNGARQAHKVPALVLALLPELQHIWVATDSDEAGESSAKAAMVAAEELGIKSTRLLPLGSKDVTEFYQSGLTLRDCLRGTLVNGHIEYK